MSLDLYLGPMFAGKSSAIIGILRRNKVIGLKTLCITHTIDKRFSAEAQIVSHNKDSAPALALNSLDGLGCHPAVKEADCIIIEEAQFFQDLKKFVVPLVDTLKKNVICVGLNGDSDRQPFGELLDLVPYCDSVQKFGALCTRCADGTNAIFTFRLPGGSTEQVNVGGEEQYESLCRAHYLEGELEKGLNDNTALERFYKNIIRPVCSTSEEVLDRCMMLVGVQRGSDLYTKMIKFGEPVVYRQIPRA